MHISSWLITWSWRPLINHSGIRTFRSHLVLLLSLQETCRLHALQEICHLHVQIGLVHSLDYYYFFVKYQREISQSIQPLWVVTVSLPSPSGPFSDPRRLRKFFLGRRRWRCDLDGVGAMSGEKDRLTPMLVLPQTDSRGNSRAFRLPFDLTVNKVTQRYRSHLQFT